MPSRRPPHQSAAVELAGRPAAAGSFPVVLKVTDAAGSSTQQTVTITVTSEPLSLTIDELWAVGHKGVTESLGFVRAASGVEPHVFSAVGLPNGLTIDSTTGEVRGTASTNGVASVTITVTDAESATASKTWDVEIKNGEPTSVGWQPGTYSTKAFLPFTFPGLPPGGTATFTSTSRKPDGSPGNAVIECKEWATAQFGCTVTGTAGSLMVNIFATTTEIDGDGSLVNAYATISRQMSFTMSGPTQLSMGRDYGCARYENTTIRCWGDNSVGQLGHTFAVATPSSPEPVTVTDANGNAITGFTQVWANANSEPGKQFTCGRRAFRATPAATTDTIEYLCWGYGLEGQLGNGLMQSSTVPVKAGVPFVTPFTAQAGRDTGMVLGGARACVGIEDPTQETSLDGSYRFYRVHPYCWGDGSATASEIPGNGDPLEFENRNSPLSGKLDTRLFVNAAGYCFHDTYNGRNNTIFCKSVTESISGMLGYVTAGRRHFCMSKSGNRGPALPEGTGYCWGDNTEQQLGTSGSAQYISGEFDLTSSLSAGGDTTCGRWRAGTTGSYQLKCWGSPFAGSTAGTLVTITNAPSGSVSVGTARPVTPLPTLPCHRSASVRPPMARRLSA